MSTVIATSPFPTVSTLVGCAAVSTGLCRRTRLRRSIFDDGIITILRLNSESTSTFAE